MTHLTPEPEPKPDYTLDVSDPGDPKFSTPDFSTMPVDELVGQIIDERLRPIIELLTRLRPPITPPASSVVGMILAGDPDLPKPTRKPTNGGKPFDEWSPIFLQVLSETSNVRAACRRSGTTRQTAYTHKKQNKRFSELWDLAVQEGDDLLEATARDIAMIERDKQMIMFLLRVRRYPSSTMVAARAVAADGSSAAVEIGPYDDYKNRLIAKFAMVDEPDETSSVSGES